MRRPSQILVAALLAVTATVAHAQVTVLLDDFNRADSTILGTDWTEHAGDIQILSNRVSGTDLSLMTFNNQAATAISADVFMNGSSLQYGALVVGFADITNNLFVKVQNNSSSTGFDTVFFYYGNNGNGFGAESTTFAVTPFTSAHMSLSLVGTVATLGLDTNFDGNADHTFIRNDVPTSSLGTGVGLGFYGATAFDNFALVAVPEPGVTPLLVIGLGLSGLAQWRRRRTRSSGR